MQSLRIGNLLNSIIAPGSPVDLRLGPDPLMQKAFAHVCDGLTLPAFLDLETLRLEGSSKPNLRVQFWVLLHDKLREQKSVIPAAHVSVVMEAMHRKLLREKNETVREGILAVLWRCASSSGNLPRFFDIFFNDLQRQKSPILQQKSVDFLLYESKNRLTKVAARSVEIRPSHYKVLTALFNAACGDPRYPSDWEQSLIRLSLQLTQADSMRLPQTDEDHFATGLYDLVVRRLIHIANFVRPHWLKNTAGLLRSVTAEQPRFVSRSYVKFQVRLLNLANANMVASDYYRLRTEAVDELGRVISRSAKDSEAICELFAGENLKEIWKVGHSLYDNFKYVAISIATDVEKLMHPRRISISTWIERLRYDANTVAPMRQ